MKTRKQISEKVKKNVAKIEALKSENLELLRESYLLCDKKQNFTEVEEDVLICGRPKKYERKLIGRVHWVEDFVDEDTGSVFSINRSQIVRINGEWV